MLCFEELLPLVSVASAQVAALVLQMLQLAQVHGSLHSLGLEGAAGGSGVLDLLTHVEVGARITRWGLRGELWISREVLRVRCGSTSCGILWD